MSYADVLQSCLERLRHGETPEVLITEYPQHADKLRFDLSAAAAARGVSSRLPATSSDARARFQRDLQAQRQAAAHPKQRGGWFRWTLALPVAAVAAAVLLVAALAGGIVLPANTAEASIEAVVVANDGSNLTVQTEDGQQSIALADAVVADENGASIDLATLEPGLLVVVRGKQAKPASIVARRIELKSAQALQFWCQRNVSQCATAEQELAQRTDRCQQSPVICSRIRARLELLQNEIAARTRVSDLQQRCESGTVAACREVQQLCTTERPVCGPIRQWLRDHRPAPIDRATPR